MAGEAVSKRGGGAADSAGMCHLCIVRRGLRRPMPRLMVDTRWRRSARRRIERPVGPWVESRPAVAARDRAGRSSARVMAIILRRPHLRIARHPLFVYYQPSACQKAAGGIRPRHFRQAALRQGTRKMGTTPGPLHCSQPSPQPAGSRPVSCALRRLQNLMRSVS